MYNITVVHLPEHRNRHSDNKKLGKSCNGGKSCIGLLLIDIECQRHFVVLILEDIQQASYILVSVFRNQLVMQRLDVAQTMEPLKQYHA